MPTPPTTLHRVRCECGAIYAVQTAAGLLVCDSCKRKVGWGDFEDSQPLNQNPPSSAAAPPAAAPIKTPTDFGWVLGLYKVGYWIFFVVIFFGCWIYSIAVSGFIIGVLIGWLPSAIVAAIASIFWPFLLIGILWLVAHLRA
jgi:hypothetical protein